MVRQGGAWVGVVWRPVVKHLISGLLSHDPPLSVRVKLVSDRRRRQEKWRRGRLGRLG